MKGSISDTNFHQNSLPINKCNKYFLLKIIII